MTYYIKGGSRYNAANPKVWVGLFLGGFPDADYLLTDWINLDDKGHETAQDPFYRLGGASGGAKEFELGLWNDFRIKFETTGITYWDGDSWNDLLTGGGGKDNLYELDDVVIDGTPADNELLAWDNGSSKWINQTPGEAGLATAGHGHGQLHDESHTLASHSSEAHNELTGYNDETDVKHLTDAQLGALHSIYSLENHASSFHTDSYEPANANIQSHVASPVTDAHHAKYTDAEALNHIQATGLNFGILTTPIITDNVNQYSTFGRCQIGVNGSGYAYFGYRGIDGTTFMIRQDSTFETVINSASGKNLAFMINGVGVGHFSASHFYCNNPIYMYSHTIKMLGNGVEPTDAMAFGQKYTNSEVDTRIGLANHDVLQNPNGNAEEQHLTSAQQGALHAILTNLNQLATREHTDLQNKNTHADYKHITTPQLIALHPQLTNLTELGTRNHNDLLNINAGDNYEHITLGQKNLLHVIYQSVTAIQAVEDTGLVLSATKTITTANEDTIHTFGRNQLGAGVEAGYAVFGFRGMGGNEYTIRANSAFTETRINVGQGAGSKIRMGVNESNTLNIGVNGVTFGIGDEVNQFDNGTVANNSAIRVPTQQAVKTYHDANKTVAGDLNLNDLAEKSHDNLADVSINDHHAEVHAMSIHSNEGNHVTHNYGSGASTVCQGNDGRLTNNRTPTQHALDSTTYHTINANTTFNATTSKHGFLKLLDNDATKFMNGQGNWAIPAGEGGGSLKGQLQGHIVPLVGCVWGSSGINMYDANDSAICTFDLTANIDAGEDIVLGFVYANTWDSQSTMKLYVGIQKTNGTEALTWNYINGSNYVLSTSATDFSFKLKTWTIPNAVFDTNDTITVYFLNQSGVNFRAHSMYLRYTEAV